MSAHLVNRFGVRKLEFGPVGNCVEVCACQYPHIAL